jgi:hypothetical protein
MTMSTMGGELASAPPGQATANGRPAASTAAALLSRPCLDETFLLVIGHPAPLIASSSH